jgi:hypothetical protein
MIIKEIEFLISFVILNLMNYLPKSNARNKRNTCHNKLSTWFLIYFLPGALKKSFRMATDLKWTMMIAFFFVEIGLSSSGCNLTLTFLKTVYTRK